MNDLLTTKQVQDYLQIDRTTVYRMLKDGRLTGVKVGQQWRFLREEVEVFRGGADLSLKKEDKDAASVDVSLPCRTQLVQDVFAELAEVGAVTTALNGEPLTDISNVSDFCGQILASSSGRQACIASWRELGKKNEGRRPRFISCHAGLQYARARIEVEDQFAAMLIAGQFYADTPDPKEEKARVEQLAKAHTLDADALLNAAQSLPVLDERIRDRIGEWLEKVAHTFEAIRREHLNLINRLQRIAAISDLEKVQ